MGKYKLKILIFRSQKTSFDLLHSISKFITIKKRLIQLGCRRLTKSLHNNSNTYILAEEYLGFISSIKRRGKISTPLCVLLPYIALTFTCQVYVFVAALWLNLIEN